MTSSNSGVLDLIDQTTVLSLASTVAILAAAWTVSLRVLPRDASTKVRIMFIWHAFDGLIHFFLEAGYLYNCMFTYITIIPGTLQSPYTSPGVHMWGRSDRLYGPEYGTNPLAALWREYAKADARWGGSDLTIISLEILTVGVAGPLDMWICYSLVKRRADTWFWMIFVAVAELYGGFMTFAPEWLSGNPNLDTSNWMYMWLYLFFFNMLWVWIPVWVLYEAYIQLTKGAHPAGRVTLSKKSK